MHPGPVDNQDLAERLVNFDDVKDTNTGYYQISKPLFYFFVSQYGGGPAIISNSLFQQRQVLQAEEDVNGK